MFHDHNEINSEISNRQNWKIPNTWKLNNLLPTNQCVSAKNQSSKPPPSRSYGQKGTN